MSEPLRIAMQETIRGLLDQIPESAEQAFPEKTSYENLRWMMQRCLRELDTFPLDKMNRWIGFVQGVLAARGDLNVDEERNRTRPIFHKVYTALGIEIPATEEQK